MSRSKVSFTIDQEILDDLNMVATELQEKKSHIIEKALTMYFDLLDVKIADKRMTDIEKGKSRLIPAEQVYRELGF